MVADVNDEIKQGRPTHTPDPLLHTNSLFSLTFPFLFSFLIFFCRYCVASRCWGPAAKGGYIVAATSLVSPTVVMIALLKIFFLFFNFYLLTFLGRFLPLGWIIISSVKPRYPSNNNDNKNRTKKIKKIDNKNVHVFGLIPFKWLRGLSG